MVGGGWPFFFFFFAKSQISIFFSPFSLPFLSVGGFSFLNCACFYLRFFPQYSAFTYRGLDFLSNSSIVLPIRFYVCFSNPEKGVLFFIRSAELKEKHEIG